MLGTQAQHGLPVWRERPGILSVGALQLRLAPHTADTGAHRVAGPVAGDGRGQVLQLVAVQLHTEVDDVRTLDAIGSPRAAQRQVDPAGAAAIGQRSRPTLQGVRQRVGGRVLALLVPAVVVEAGRGGPVPGAAGVAPDREAMHRVRDRLVRHREVAAGEGESIARIHVAELDAIDDDGAAVDRLTAGIAQIGHRPAFRRVVPQAEGVGRAHRGRHVVGELDLEVVLLRRVLGAGTEHIDRFVGVVALGHCSGDHGAGAGRCHAVLERAGREGQRLSMAVGVVEVGEPAPVARPVAQRCAGLPRLVGGAGAVQVEGLGREAGLGVGLELRRHARHVVDHGADRVAWVGGREGPVHHVDALDLLGRDHAPARREAQPADPVAEVVRQQDAVGIHRRPRAVARTRGAAREDGVVVVADVALAHQQAGEVLERILAVGGVDGALDLLARHAFHRCRNLGGQRGGLASADDGDDPQVLGGCCVCRIGRAGLGDGLCRKGNRQRE